MIDATPHELEIVDRILARYVPNCEVRAFGSRANWSAKDYSDLDLAVVGETTLDQLIVDELKEAFAESDLRYRVDVVDWHAVSDAFRDAIRDESVRIRNSANEEWQETTLGECADVFNETVSPTELGDTPYIGLEHIGENSLALLGWGSAEDVTSTKSRFRKGDVLFGKLRPYFRKVIRAPFDGIGSTDIWVIRPKNGIDAGYLYYLMATQQVVDFATQGSIGTKMPQAKWDHVSRYPVNLPPLPEQRRIAHILGTLDDKIELNRRMNETLEEMARAVFKDWFVDFGPVRAKMEGRDAYLPEESWRLFPDRLVESELGEVPEGWGVRRLGDCYDLTMGQSPPGHTYNDDSEGVPFFQGRTDFGFRYPMNRRYCTAPTRFAEFDDTLISVRAPVGDINMAWERCCVGRGLAALRHNSGSRSFTYYSALAIQDRFRDYEHTGTVFGSINKQQFQALEMIEPDYDLVMAFENQVGSLDSQVRNSTSDMRAIEAIRDSLLPRLVSGELIS